MIGSQRSLKGEVPIAVLVAQQYYDRTWGVTWGRSKKTTAELALLL